MTTGGPFPDNAASTSKAAVGTSQLSNSTQSTIVCPAASGITTTVGNWSPMNSPRKPIVCPWRAVAPPMPQNSRYNGRLAGRPRNRKVTR
eukprot:scaffold128677_cov51-Attheya_sp.AAC.7